MFLLKQRWFQTEIQDRNHMQTIRTATIESFNAVHDLYA